MNIAENLVRAGSLPSREAWIEIKKPPIYAMNSYMSLPSREAWIEITTGKFIDHILGVASLAGSVD